MKTKQAKTIIEIIKLLDTLKFTASQPVHKITIAGVRNDLIAMLGIAGYSIAPNYTIKKYDNHK